MGKNWAITIGINQYDNLQDLQFAQRDAEQMREFFLQDMRMAPENIYHFTADSAPIPANAGRTIKSRPNYTGLRQFLRIRFDQPFLKAQDNLWFFFAGHGVQYEGHDYLMPLDGDPGDVIGSAIALSYVTERLRRSGAENIILFIDACRSRSRRGLGVGEEIQQGVITFYACSPRQQSYEIDDPDIQHGSFTYALLEGLRLQGSRENCATVERLNQHLEQRVPQINEQYNQPVQQPYSKIEPLKKGHLILFPRLADLQDVQTLKMDAYRAETSQNLREAKQLWYRVLAVNGTDTEAIGAIERLARISTNAALPPPTASVPSPAPPAQSRQSTAEPKTPATPTVSQDPPLDDYLEDLGNGVELAMVSIPAGKFLMGSPSTELERADFEGPQHDVSISAFWMGKYPVTQAQWERVASLPQVTRKLNPKPSRFDCKELPVERVSWHEAIEFCQRLSTHTGKTYQLPSEAQWEYACRAGTQTPFYFGETITPDQANYDGNYTYGNGQKGQYRGTTTAVGTFPPNEFGLYDMHGNVYEWCLDYWHGSYRGAPTDGSAWLSENENESRLLRGGSWNYNPRNCRSAFRGCNTPDDQLNIFGFRVACLSARAF